MSCLHYQATIRFKDSSSLLRNAFDSNREMYLNEILLLKIHGLDILWLLDLIVVDVLKTDVNRAIIRPYDSLEFFQPVFYQQLV